MPLNNVLRLFIITSLLGLVACGPMNKPPSQEAASTQANGTVIGGAAVSKASQFIVYASASTVSPSRGAVLGDNNLLIRFAHSKDLHPPTPQAKVTVSYLMPTMPEMGTSTETASVQSDGSFTSPLFLSMAGKWRVTVTIEDMGSKDDYSFEISI